MTVEALYLDTAADEFYSTIDRKEPDGRTAWREALALEKRENKNKRETERRDLLQSADTLFTYISIIRT